MHTDEQNRLQTDDQDRLVITRKEKAAERTRTVSLRIPQHVIDSLDMICMKTNRSRNSVISIAVEWALTHAKIALPPEEPEEAAGQESDGTQTEQTAPDLDLDPDPDAGDRDDMDSEEDEEILFGDTIWGTGDLNDADEPRESGNPGEDGSGNRDE